MSDNPTIARRLSKWFDGRTTEPEMKGVYQRKFRAGFVYSYWNGAFWMVGDRTVDQANVPCGKSLEQDCPWRGLLDKPKEYE